MRNSYEMFPLANATPQLQTRIEGRIKILEKRALFIRRSVFGTLSTASLLLIVPVTSFTLEGLSRSGFFEYLSLLSSDGPALSSAFSEFMLSLTEALPLAEITTVFALLLVFFLSLGQMQRGGGRSSMLTAQFA